MNVLICLCTDIWRETLTELLDYKLLQNSIGLVAPF